MLRVGDLQLPDGCKTSIGGDTQLAAVPLGKRTLRRIYACATAFCCAGGELTWHTFAPTTPPSVARTRSPKTYGVVWREPDRDQFGLSIPVNQTTRGAEAMRLGGRPTQRGAPHDGDQRPGRAEEVGSCRLGTTRAAGSTRRR